MNFYCKNLSIFFSFGSKNFGFFSFSFFLNEWISFFKILLRTSTPEYLHKALKIWVVFCNKLYPALSLFMLKPNILRLQLVAKEAFILQVQNRNVRCLSCENMIIENFKNNLLIFVFSGTFDESFSIWIGNSFAKDRVEYTRWLRLLLVFLNLGLSYLHNMF